MNTVPGQANHGFVQRGDRNAAIRVNSVPGGAGSIHSDKASFSRGQTKMMSYGNNDFSGFGAAQANQGVEYGEPVVDVLAESRRAQIEDALNQSAQKASGVMVADDA